MSRHFLRLQQALLVGGFAASPWLFARLKVLLQLVGLELSRPDNHTYVPDHVPLKLTT